MINYQYEVDFELGDPTKYTEWLLNVAASEQKRIGEITYVFVSDPYLLDINVKYLNHDYFTDILTFDYSIGEEFSGDIFISVDRVRENALLFNQKDDVEFLRVMVHGLLHLFGYKDSNKAETEIMRKKEDELIKLFHVEH